MVVFNDSNLEIELYVVICFMDCIDAKFVILIVFVELMYS